MLSSFNFFFRMFFLSFSHSLPSFVYYTYEKVSENKTFLSTRFIHIFSFLWSTSSTLFLIFFIVLFLYYFLSFTLSLLFVQILTLLVDDWMDIIKLKNHITFFLLHHSFAYLLIFSSTRLFRTFFFY